MWKVDGNGILLLWISLSFIWITWGHGYIYICVFFSFFFFMDIDVSIFFWVMLLGHAIFSLFSFFIAHASIEGYERERSLNMEFYFVDGWNMVANFQCRSLACGVHMILIKQVWKTSHYSHKVWKKLNATTRHICVRFVSWRLTYGFGRTNTWSC